MENINVENIRGKKVLVVGLGKSGIATVHTMIQLGAQVTVQDSKEKNRIEGQLLNYLESRKVKCHFNTLPSDEESFDMMILSPGVNPELDFVEKERQKGAEVIGELEIAYRLARGKFVAITGTNGKTTTTTMVGEIFRNSKRTTHVVGNIGVAVISKALESKEDDWLITETSSFQLQTIKYFKPKIAAILNLTPDHLNRHHTMEEYGAAKGKIWQNQDSSGYLIINQDDPVCWNLTMKNLAEPPKAKIVPFSTKKQLNAGAFLDDDILTVRDFEGKERKICHKDELKILGNHNVENCLAAIAISYFAGIDPKVIRETLIQFKGVEHRLEYVGEVDGIRFYNDSKGTNVDATVTALKSIEKNIILIAGGDGKKQDFHGLISELKGRVKKLVLLGQDKELIRKTAAEGGFEEYVLCQDMEDSVKEAFRSGTPGDVVLLSPACASWDMYENFEQRGNHFKDCVKRLES